MRSFSALPLLFAMTVLFSVMTLRTADAALPWKVQAATNDASVASHQVTTSHSKVGRTIEFLAFNDGAMGYFP
jgi:hypothetical protein